MHGVLPAQAQRAIFHDVQSCIDKTTGAQSCGFESDQWFKRIANALFSSKPGATLHFLTSVPERTCQAYAAGSRDPGDFIVRLLRSSEGKRVLDHIMRGCKQPWWREHQLAEIHYAARVAYDATVAQAQLELGL